MVFFGYEPGSKAYRVYDLVDNRVHVSRDVVFDEEAKWDWGTPGADDPLTAPDEFFSVEHFFLPVTGDGEVDALEHGGDAAGTPSTPGRAPIPGSPTLASPPTDASQASEEAPRWYRTIADLYDTTDEVAVEDCGLCLLATEEPVNFAEAEQHKCWRQAMLEEMRSIDENSTWKLCDLPADHHLIGLK